MSSFTTPLIVTPMPDGRKWKLFRSFKYHIGSRYNKNVISVPAGFITDFASVPRLTSPIATFIGLGLYLFGFHILGIVILTIICVLSWFTAWGKHGKAAVLHDRLYHTKEVSRHMADLIFKEAMLVSKTSFWKAQLMYYGVRIGGWMAWRVKKC